MRYVDYGLPLEAPAYRAPGDRTCAGSRRRQCLRGDRLRFDPACVEEMRVNARARETAPQAAGLLGAAEEPVPERAQPEAAVVAESRAVAREPRPV